MGYIPSSQDLTIIVNPNLSVPGTGTYILLGNCLGFSCLKSISAFTGSLILDLETRFAEGVASSCAKIATSRAERCHAGIPSMVSCKAKRSLEGKCLNTSHISGETSAPSDARARALAIVYTFT